MRMCKKWLASLLVLVMLLSALAPAAFAVTAENVADETVYADSATDDGLTDVTMADTAQVQPARDVSDYASFLANLKVLEGYAQTYAREHVGEDAVGLTINYIRCGVAKYTGGTWTMLAGKEKADFTAYVTQQDGLCAHVRLHGYHLSHHADKRFRRRDQRRPWRLGRRYL